jgi:hypothetical protein
MSTDSQENPVPQSIRHKQILDLAEENPSASFGEIANQVTSATTELVEQVIEEYGDPASADESSSEDTESKSAVEPSDMKNETENMKDDAESETISDKPTGVIGSNEPKGTEETSTAVEQDTTDEDSGTLEMKQDRYPSLEELSEKQQALLEAVAKRPTATQKELSTKFDVTRATISRWADDIPEFEWHERDVFVDAVFDSDLTTDMNDQSTPDSDAADTDQTPVAEGVDDADATVAEIETDLRKLTERVAALEDADTDAGQHHDPVFEDPEIVHKIVHACLDSDAISESEELRILKRLLE